jgi:hypothetical protein
MRNNDFALQGCTNYFHFFIADSHTDLGFFESIFPVFPFLVTKSLGIVNSKNCASFPWDTYTGLIVQLVPHD